MQNKTEIKEWKYANIGNGPTFQPVDIGHEDYMALIEPDSAFWSLIKKDKIADVFSDSSLMAAYKEKAETFSSEMERLRFSVLPQAVYFNPTDRCNLNCKYCYIPDSMRKDGSDMTEEKLMESLEILKEYFTSTLPKDVRPQIIFHGAEPMMNKEAMFKGIDAYKDYFRFGVQTNGTLLDDESIEFLTGRGIGIGLSIDGHQAMIADRARQTWDNQGVSEKVVEAMNKLKGYRGYNVICTVTTENMEHLVEIVEYFHKEGVSTCMLNPVRCTRQGARDIKPDETKMAAYFTAALDKSHELYKKTGRKLVIANFANVMLGVIAPAARKMMCDISPCGGGRAFFALSADGGLFPCSEFIGLPEFNGGNLFDRNLDAVLNSDQFKTVTGRKVEDIDPCKRCAIRHFCGSPCPAEAHEMNGSMQEIGAFCRFYEEQVRYALRAIADKKEEDFLWDNWSNDTELILSI